MSGGQWVLKGSCIGRRASRQADKEHVLPQGSHASLVLAFEKPCPSDLLRSNSITQCKDPGDTYLTPPVLLELLLQLRLQVCTLMGRCIDDLHNCVNVCSHLASTKIGPRTQAQLMQAANSMSVLNASLFEILPAHPWWRKMGA